MTNQQGVIPHLAITGAAKAIDFYVKAFGAKDVMRMPAEDGKRLMHAELMINGARVFLHDDFPEYREKDAGAFQTPPTEGGSGVTLHLTVADCDAAIKRAADAGATVTMPAEDMFWGDRYGQVKDPFGHSWSFSHPLKKAA